VRDPTPKHRQIGVRQVVEVLNRQREEIAAYWAHLGYQTLGPPDLAMSIPDREAWGLRALETMAESLLSGCYEAADQVLSEFAAELNAKGAIIDRVIASWMQCSVATLAVLRRAYPDDPSLVLECMTQLDRCLNECTALYIKNYAVEMNRHLRQQHEQTRRMLDTAQAASSTLQLGEVLSRVAKIIAGAVGLPHCLVMVIEEESGSVDFRQVGVSDSQVWEMLFGRRLPDAMDSIGQVANLSSQVVKDRKPLVADDVDHDSRLRDVCLGSKSLLVLPFTVNDRIVALVWIMTWEDYHTFSPEEIELVQGIANVTALAIENARLHQKVKEQAILEERHRLSRELHDNLSQALGFVKLRSSLAAKDLAAHQLDQVEAALLEMHEIAAEAYTDAREAILGLRSMGPDDAGFLPALQHYLARYHASFGMDVALKVDERDEITLAPQASAQVLRIIHEALSNVRKHASACEAWVCIERAGDLLRICIEDDGQGFDMEALGQQETRGLGLLVMRERAQSIGGQLEIDSQLGKGTQVTVWLPQASESEEHHDAAAHPVGG
jgi:signal transduction histidine kinase